MFLAGGSNTKVIRQTQQGNILHGFEQIHQQMSTGQKFKAMNSLLNYIRLRICATRYCILVSQGNNYCMRKI